MVIVLKNDNKSPCQDTLTIKREITRENKSAYYINGAVSTQREVNRRVTGLGIQVDNLCQFLPQDRVSDFAKMTPAEVLQETEKASGTLEK